MQEIATGAGGDHIESAPARASSGERIGGTPEFLPGALPGPALEALVVRCAGRMKRHDIDGSISGGGSARQAENLAAKRRKYARAFDPAAAAPACYLQATIAAAHPEHRKLIWPSRHDDRRASEVSTQWLSAPCGERWRRGPPLRAIPPEMV